jgi:hypothetical protein
MKEASPVTAVGRLLKPKHGEPRIHRTIAVGPRGNVKVIIDQRLG